MLLMLEGGHLGGDVVYASEQIHPFRELCLMIHLKHERDRGSGAESEAAQPRGSGALGLGA